MASSGSFNTSAYKASDGTRYLTFSWEELSQSVDSNTTTISWSLRGGGSSKQYIYAGAFKVVIAGETVFTQSDRIKLYNGTTVKSGTFTFTHNTDGTKSFTASAEAGIFIHAVNCEGTSTFSLDTIPRASQPSLVTYPNSTSAVGDFGEEFSIHMNSASQTFKHTVRYEFGKRSGTIATGVVNGTNWTVPLDFMNDIPNATRASGRIFVDTYDAFSQKIGTKYTGFTVTVPASVKPRCTVQVLDNTNIQATYGNLVKGLSKLYVKTNFYGSYNSTVDRYIVTANGAAYQDAEIVTGYISKAGTTTITARVTDSRGRTSDAASASFTVLDYAPPKITALSVHRCDKDGTANDRGDYVEVLFSGEVSPINNKNSATYTIRYKQSSATSWTNLVTDANGQTPISLQDNYAVSNQSFIFAADGSSSYDVEVGVQDNHNSGQRSTSASTAFTLMNFHPDGDSIRFGGVAEEGYTFQNDLKLKQTENSYCFYSVGSSGVKGYVAIAKIEVTHTNANAPITFCLTRRNSSATMTVHVRFKNVSASNPDIDSIVYEGQNYGAFLCQEAASVWTLYVEKTSQNDPITLQKWTTSMFMDGRILVTFPGGQVETLPNPYYRATPAILDSIIDCLLPVGMIIQLYSHADPNDMYPGTTWERLSNTFLWGCDASGSIGTTGGEKTHALTVNELPVHSHGAVYSANATGTKSQAWYSASGDKLAYGVVETGGGQAHNNMPPYTQVSIWRRTG